MTGHYHKLCYTRAETTDKSGDLIIIMKFGFVQVYVAVIKRATI